MNNLSLFLYLSDVLTGAGSVAGLFSLLLFVGIPLVIGITAISKSDNTSVYDKTVNPDKYKYWSEVNVFKPLKYIWIPILLMVIAIIIPEKDTLYLIMASEGGEAAITSEAGQEILNAAQDALVHQLQQLSKTE